MPPVPIGSIERAEGVNSADTLPSLIIRLWQTLEAQLDEIIVRISKESWPSHRAGSLRGWIAG